MSDLANLLYALWDLAVPILAVAVIRLLQDRHEQRQLIDWLAGNVRAASQAARDAEDRLVVAQALHHDSQQTLDAARAELAAAHTVNHQAGELMTLADHRLDYAEAEIARLQAENVQLKLHLLRQGVNRFITVHTN